MKVYINKISPMIMATVLLIFSNIVTAQTIPEILNNSEHFLPDFSYAGYKFGMEEIPNTTPVVIHVTDYGAIADDELDDTHAIIKAIEAANNIESPVTVRFPKGKFIITEIIEITRSDFVLQGAGRGDSGTILYFPRPLKMVDDGGRLNEIREYLVKNNKRQIEKKHNLNVLYSEYSWTAGFIWVGEKNRLGFNYLDEYSEKPPVSLSAGLEGQQGQREIRVEDGKQFKVGQRIQVLWHNRQGKDGALIKSLYKDTKVKIGSRHWTRSEYPLVQQRTVIEHVNGNLITIADTLLHNINSTLPTNIAAWSPLENIGIEDFKFEFPNAPYFGHHVEQGYNGIYLVGLADSWARNIRFINADSAVITYDSANLTISDIVTSGKRQAHYAVHMGNVHNVLAQNIQIFNPVTHSLTFNTQSTRCVYKDSEVFVQPNLDQHAGANHQNLFDNITMHINAIPGEKHASYPVYDGSGAGYWQPGHGRFNTTWNLKIVVESGAPGMQTLHVEGLEEGPDARIVGLSGNRPITLEYVPTPYVESLNKRIDSIPSLYTFQLTQRKKRK
ncbi:glycosyl hydrolase family 28-related protein [Alteromonas sp. M12]|uniref:glycosyl hydrolase family 28-related protein n=1 Tax=Alteromonas sp. M12 TaxID=3135644 RepID=UPI00319DB251